MNDRAWLLEIGVLGSFVGIPLLLAVISAWWRQKKGRSKALAAVGGVVKWVILGVLWIVGIFAFGDNRYIKDMAEQMEEEQED